MPAFAIAVGLEGVKTIGEESKKDLEGYEFKAKVVDRDKLMNKVKLFYRNQCINKFVQ